MAETGWQAHTIRAALSGLRKSGVTLTRRREGEDTIHASVVDGRVVKDAPNDRAVADSNPTFIRPVLDEGAPEKVGEDAPTNEVGA